MSWDDSNQSFGSQFLSRRRNYLGSIKKDLKDLQGTRSLMGELTQNADDAGGAETIRFKVTRDALTVWNDSEFSKCADVTTDACAWLAEKPHRCDFHSFREVASGDKEARERTTGAFGIGFTSVYQITDRPELSSNGEHWTLDETADESERIDRTSGVSTEGTTFLLPWARENSSMRRELAQPVVTDERIEELIDELIGVAPELLLFVRNLKWLHISARNKTRTYHASVAESVVTIEDDSGAPRRWLVLNGDVGEAASQLLEAYPTLIHPDRPTEVQIAIELCAEPAPGIYFVTLPTEQSTGLPLSVNGSFFPKPDRKRIRLDDDPEGRWNQAIIDCAAELLASALELLAAEVGDQWIVRLLRAAHELSLRAGVELETPHTRWWARLGAALATRRVVPTSTGEYRSASEVLLTNDDAVEAPAAPVLAKLGVQLIKSDVRNDWFQLNNDAKVGLKQLRLNAVTTALDAHQRGLTEPWIASEFSQDERHVFWQVTDHLTNVLRSSGESRRAAANLPLVPLRDGEIVVAKTAVNATPSERDILIDGGVGAPLLDEQFANSYRELAQLTPTLSPVSMAAFVGAAFERGSVPQSFDRARVLDWFANRSDESVKLDRAVFASLPIFPTGTGFDTSRELVLPVEGFKPPLRLGNLFYAQNRPSVVHPFLVAIGIPSLDLPHFCTELVPKAVENGLSGSELNQLIVFLAKNLSQVKEDEDVRRSLRDLPLVSCTDGVVRRGRDAYFGDVDPLVVGERPVAAPVSGQTTTDLFAWLGVASRPRAANVVEHCLTFQSPPPRHVEAVSAVLRHLQVVDRKLLDASYSALQKARWLPVLSSPEAALPREVFTTFQRYLFASQAQFLGVSQGVQRSTAQALDWLGVETDPPTELVVNHLLQSASDAIPVNREVLVVLNRRADEPAIDRLKDKRSIEVGERGYVYPSLCFWDSNPFDRHRILLSPEFRQFQELFDRIGVRSAPDAGDVIDVLGEIASSHGGALQPLLEQDIPIVQSCWVLLDELIRSDDVTQNQLDELRRTECVLDSNNWLRRPEDVLYRDSSQVAKQLSLAASARLIPRPDNMKVALDAVGVRHLRQALTTQIVEREDRPDQSGFKALVDERRQVLARVLDGFDSAPFTLLDRFLDTVDVRPLHRLVVLERLDLEGAPDDPAPSDRAALWDDTRRELLIVEEQGRWPEIAREFALALGIEGDDVAQAATPLMNVLKASSREDASAELDLLGYHDVAQAVDPGLSAIVSGLPESVPEPPGGLDEGAATDDDSVATQSAVRETDASRALMTEAGGSASAESLPPLTRGSAPASNPAPAPGTKPPSGTVGSGSSSGVTGHSASTGGSGGAPGTSAGQPKRHELQQSRPRQRLISYVTDGSGDGTEDDDAEPNGARSATDAAAVEAVLAFERSMGREPEAMSHSNPGFDITSVEPDGSIRYIEVKGTASAWDDLGVGITSRQFEEGRKRGAQYWLYVVVVTTNGPSEPFRIQDPASRIDRYYFDGGWRSAAEQSVARFKELSDLATFGDPAELAAPVPLLHYVDGSDSGAWVPCPAECLDQIGAGLFAVRIAGETLGLLYRGGVAFAVPTDDVGDRDPVVVQLLGRVDPETGGGISVRYFGEELSATGELVSVRLETDTGVPPISIDDLDAIKVLGRVVFKQLPE